MSEKDIKKTQKEETGDKSYYDAKAEQYKGRYQPSKRHNMSLVAYIENKEGDILPLYREEE